MHAHILWARQLTAEGLHFHSRQDFQARNDHLTGPMLLAQQPVEPEVAGFAGEQIALELSQFRIGAVLSQQRHALMAAGLNQASHQKTVELAQGLLAANLPGQP